MKGSKIHVAVTPRSLPIVTGLGPGNEHESRKLIPLLNNIQIKNKSRRPKSRPQCIWADTKYHTFIVLTYLCNRRIRAQIKERSNTKAKHGRPKIFLYQYYRKVRSSVERFFGWLNNNYCIIIVFFAGGGFLFGAVAGYAIKKVMKIAAAVIGLFVVGLSYLTYKGWIDVKWVTMENLRQRMS